MRRTEVSKRGLEYRLPSEWPIAKRSDVVNPEAVVAALYEVISGPAEEARNWDRLRSLCLPTAQFLIARWMEPGSEKEGLWEWDVEGFVTEAEAFYSKNGFWEQEISARVERFGNIAHVFSTFESRLGSPETAPVGRGINSFQMVRYEGRWWIANVCWDMEGPDHPMPPEYVAG